jgi:hypothetical protein
MTIQNLRDIKVPDDFIPGSADEPVVVVAFADIDSDRNRIRHMIKRHQFIYGSVNRAKVESGELDLHELHERLHARSAGLDHEHSAETCDKPVKEPLDGPDVPPVVFRPPTVRPHTGNGPCTASRPTPTPEQAAAAWSCDLRNPAFARDSRGTTVIVDESDYNGGFEMV